MMTNDNHFDSADHDDPELHAQEAAEAMIDAPAEMRAAICAVGRQHARALRQIHGALLNLPEDEVSDN